MTADAGEPLVEPIRRARTRLVAAGIAPDEAAIDIDVYVMTILGWDRARLVTQLRDPAPAGLEPRFADWVERRAHREPTAYIVGTKEFWGRDFHVTPAVLIPRPETELIVEAALPLVRLHPAPRIADVGTGSGAIVVTLACELPQSTCVATDISGPALDVARDNASRHGVADRIQFVETSYLHGVAGPFDLIVANPPYVKDGDRRGLSPTVLREPGVALFGGTDGLRDLAGVLDSAAPRLGRDARLVMEFGLGQEDVVVDLATGRGFRVERVLHDLQGIARTIVLVLP